MVWDDECEKSELSEAKPNKPKRIMKSILNQVAAACVLLGLSASTLLGDVPNYRGKIVLLVDKTLSANSTAEPKIERLAQDLVNDGWAVLRHDVERGPAVPFQDPGDTGILNGQNIGTISQASWAAQTAHQIREMKAIIKADYNADPNNVKAVFLLGHIAIPYSGDAAPENGGHPDWVGANPADIFYGEMSGLYGPGGWSDFSVDNSRFLANNGLGIPNDPNGRVAVSGGVTYPWNGYETYRQLVNRPSDGKYDQDFLPSPLKLAVGRVDLYNMPTFNDTTKTLHYNETALLCNYLDKDHDFRVGSFTVSRKAWLGCWLALDNSIFHLPIFPIPTDAYAGIVGAANVDSLTQDGTVW